MIGKRLSTVLTVLVAAGSPACDSELRTLEKIQTGDAGSGGLATGGSAGSAAGAESGGTSGSGGSPLPSPFVLDDFEDGDTQSLNIPEGYWYFRPDETCSGAFVIEATPERVDNTHAIRTRGGGCTAWGALLGLDLGGSGDTFDASSFDALRLWARAEASSVTTLSVSLLDPEHFDSIIELGTGWQEFELRLNDFVYTDGGVARPHDPSKFSHLQFFVFSAESFDFWLDDVAFVRSE